MTKSFGPRVLVDFVNRWYVLQQPAGRTTIKGILQSQLFSTVLKNNTYSKSGAYCHKAINSTEKNDFISHASKMSYKNSLDVRQNMNHLGVVQWC